MTDKMPRHYAADIIAIKSRDERYEYLNSRVPEIYRAWVKELVEDSFIKHKHLRIWFKTLPRNHQFNNKQMQKTFELCR